MNLNKSIVVNGLVAVTLCLASGPAGAVIDHSSTSYIYNVGLNQPTSPGAVVENPVVIARSDSTGVELTDGNKTVCGGCVHIDPGMVYWQEDPNPDGNSVWNGPFPNVTFNLGGVHDELGSVELYYGGFVDLQGPQGMNISFSLDNVTYTSPVLYNSAPQGYPNNLNFAYHTATEPVNYNATDFQYVNIEFIPSAHPTSSTGFLVLGEVTFDEIGTFPPDPTTQEWAADGSGDWSINSNWSPGPDPKSDTATVIFADAITTPQTVLTA